MVKALSVILLSSFLIGCNLVTNHASWEQIESVGGLVVGKQDKNPNWLQLKGDVSGLHEFSKKPTIINSAFVVKEVGAEIEPGIIKIYVVTTVTSESNHGTEIRGVNIAGAKKGLNTVKYLNPDGSLVYLKEVEIN